MSLRCILAEVVVTNNECIERLQSDNLLDGVNVLHHALGRIKAIVASRNHPTDLQPILLKIQQRHEPLSSPQVLNQRSSGRTTPGTESFVICGRPLKLIYTCCEDSVAASGTDHDHSSIFKTIHLVCSVLLFNLANTMHHYGCLVQTESVRYNSVVRAWKLYTMVLEVSGFQNTTEGTSTITHRHDECNTTRKFMMALALNNMAHLSLVFHCPITYNQTMIALEQIICTIHYNVMPTHTTQQSMDLDGSTTANASNFDVATANSSATDLLVLDQIRANVICWKFGIPSSIAPTA